MTYGRWLALKLEQEFGNAPYYFDFASDTNVFRCKNSMENRINEVKKVVFVYQGDKTRRCPRLGIEALGIVKHHRPDVELHFVGSNEPPHLWYDFKNVGNITINELNALYNSCHVGLSLSSSNPSCNSFDMMAAGLPSVDLYRENNLFDVPAGGVMLALQTQESIAEAILHLLNHPTELVERSQFGIDFMAGRSQGDEVVSFLSAVDAIINGRGHGVSASDLAASLYKRAPVVAQVNRNAYSRAFLRNQWRAASQVGQDGAASDEPFYSTQELGFAPPPPLDTAGHLAQQALFEMNDGKRRRYDRIVSFLVRKLGLDARLNAAMFDQEFYLAANPDVYDAGIDPLKHFLRFGHIEGRSPSPYFDGEWYATSYPQADPSLSAVDNYLISGSALNQSPNAMFDALWYLSRNHAVQAENMHPLHHYAAFGEAEDRDPCEYFSTSWYRANNVDVSNANRPLLLHYISHGRAEGRAPTPPSQARGREDWQGAVCRAAGTVGSLFDWKPAARDNEPQFDRVDKQILSDDQLDAQISFDVWNTIIHRRCHPDEIKLRSARFLLLRSYDDVLPGLRSPVALMGARMRAENASAPHGDYEYCFNDAVGNWLNDVLNPSCSAMQREQLAKEIIAHELTAEQESIELDHNAGRTIRSLKRAPIFISDFYMSSPFIENLLNSVNVGGYFARGYVSCDGFINKRSGALFKKVLSDFNMTPQDLVHIGDNPIADMERPASLGIGVAPYVSHLDEERNSWYTKAFHGLCVNDMSEHERRILALIKAQAAHAPAGMNKEDKALYQAGCHLGLLAFGYCLNIMQDAIKRGAKEVAFFAREGILFKSLYDQIAACNPFSITAPPSKLLFVSRRATFAASIRRYDTEELMRLWTMYWKQSPVAFASSLNLDVKIAANAAKRAGLKPDVVVAAPWADDSFRTFLEDPEFKRHAVAELDRQRTMLTRYIDQELAPDQKEILIADIGWRGTIQDNLAHLLGKPLRGHYFALFGYLNEQPAFSSKVGWLSDVNNPSDYSLPDQVSPLEMIFNAPGGSTIGYAASAAGKIEPIREIFEGEEAIVSALEPCRRGMADMVPILAHYVKLHGMLADDLLNLNRKLANDVIASPPSVIADLYGRLEHNETFGVGSVEATQEMGFDKASAEPAGPELHHAFTAWLEKGWKAGLSRQTSVSRWWSMASPQQRISAPSPLLEAVAPAIIKSTGARLSIYVPSQGMEAEQLRNVASAASGLIAIGFQAEIHLQDPNADAGFVESCLGNMPALITKGWSGHRNAAIALATDYVSANYLKSSVAADCSSYFVQDSEALIQSAADRIVQTENSYTHGFSHITTGNWLTHMLNNRYRAEAYPSGPGVDTGIYRLSRTSKREQAICLHYQENRPNMAMSLALQALYLLKKQRPDVRIILFGSDIGPRVDFAYENLGRLDDAESINALFNRCIAGLTLNLSNPSRMAFEMAAAGCVPVDLYRYNTLLDYSDDFGVLAYQSPQSIASALSQLLNRDDIAKNADKVAHSVRYRSLAWERDAITASLLNALEGRKVENWGAKSAYRRDVIIAADDDTPAAREFCRQQLAMAQGR